MFIKIYSSLSEFRSHVWSEVSQALDLKAEEMKSHQQILTAKQEKSMTLKKSISRCQVARIMDGDNELKKHSRTNP